MLVLANDSSDWQVVADSTDRRLGDGKAKADFTALDPEQQGETNSLLEEKKGIESRLAELSRAQTVFGGIFGKPEPMFLLNRGDAEQPK